KSFHHHHGGWTRGTFLAGEPRENTQAVADVARQEIVFAGGRGTRAAAGAGGEYFCDHERGAIAGGAQAASQSAKGKSRGGADGARHVRGGDARRSTRGSAFDDGRDGGVAGGSCDSRCEKIPAGAGRCV